METNTITFISDHASGVTTCSVSAVKQGVCVQALASPGLPWTCSSTDDGKRVCTHSCRFVFDIIALLGGTLIAKPMTTLEKRMQMYGPMELPVLLQVGVCLSGGWPGVIFSWLLFLSRLPW